MGGFFTKKGIFGMTPIDMMSKDEWHEVLKQFARKTGMVTCLGDPKGNVIQCCSQRPSLCQAIRSKSEMLTFICSQASTTMTAVTAKTLKPELDFCQAGMMRIAIPIIRDSSMIGQIFACGLASHEEPIEVSLLANQLEVSESEVQKMINSIPVGTEETVEKEADELFAKINPVNNGLQKQPSQIGEAALKF